MTVAVERLLTEHLDTWTAAVEPKSAAGRGSSKKLNLVGIKKLRELILELAVRGQLVPQDESDEPAEVLLGRIAAERERLVKEKKIKKPKKLPEISEDEKPFDLPKGWAWARLRDIGIGSTGKTPKTSNPDFFGTEVPFIGPGQITLNGELLRPDKFLTPMGVSESSQADAGDIMMVCIGGSIGKAVIVDQQVAFNQQINAMKPIQISSKYLYLSLSAPYFYNSVLSSSTGSATPIINRLKWESLLVAVAPVKEQNRIAAKVDALMALCDALEQEQENSIAAHALLVENLLAALTNAANQGEFKQAWARVAAHFDTLFTTEQSVEQLKQTILQLAVMGKLVEQDPADEPAGVLIDRVKDKRELLIKSKIIKKRLPVQEIQEEPDLFELPKSWSWFRAAEVFTYITDGEHSTPQRVDDSSEVALVTAKNVRDGYMDYLQTDFVSREIATKCWGRCKPEPGDVLVVSVGATLGRLTVLKKPKDMVIVRSVTIFKMSEVDSDYLSIALNSITAQRWIWNNIKQSAQPCLYLSKSNNIPLPIPPLSEQKRIVKRVDQLMAFCDRLKVDIGKAKNTQIQVANTLTKLVS